MSPRLPHALLLPVVAFRAVLPVLAYLIGIGTAVGAPGPRGNPGDGGGVATVVPEPATRVLLGVGAIAVVVIRRRK